MSAWGEIGGAVAGPIVGAVLGGEYNKQAQNSAQAFSAEQARSSAAESRQARKEAPDDALNYFNKVAPDSSQSERLGVSGSAVGSVVSQPMQSAIARGGQRVAAQKMSNDISIQKAQLMQSAATQAGNNANAARISRQNNKATLAATLLQQGAPVNTVGEESEKILGGKESANKQPLPKIMQDIKTSKASEKRLKVQNLIDSGRLGLEEEKLAKQYTLSGNNVYLSKLGLVLAGKGDDIADYSRELGRRRIKRDKLIKDMK